MITKGERTELRSIVRQQFKVLRSETTQRQAELAVVLYRAALTSPDHPRSLTGADPRRSDRR